MNTQEDGFMRQTLEIYNPRASIEVPYAAEVMLYAMLDVCQQSLKSLKHEFFLADGSLLGHVRLGALLPHDWDVDVTVLCVCVF